jgi:hypothetical protein
MVSVALTLPRYRYGTGIGIILSSGYNDSVACFGTVMVYLFISCTGISQFSYITIPVPWLILKSLWLML